MVYQGISISFLLCSEKWFLGSPFWGCENWRSGREFTWSKHLCRFSVTQVSEMQPQDWGGWGIHLSHLLHSHMQLRISGPSRITSSPSFTCFQFSKPDQLSMHWTWVVQMKTWIIARLDQTPFHIFTKYRQLTRALVFCGCISYLKS